MVLSTALIIPVYASGTSTRDAGRSPIYIGQVMALTGIFAEHSRPPFYWKVGARLAVNQINAHGGIHGRPLKQVYADTHSTTDFSGDIAAFRQLASSGRVSAIIGHNYSPSIQAVTPSIEQAHIPTIIGGQAPITTHEGNRWVFRTRVNQRVETRVLATFAVSTLHRNRIAIIRADNSVFSEVAALLRSHLRTLGVTPVADLVVSFLPTDLTDQVLAIKRSGADTLISIFADFSAYVLLARQMNQAGVHLTWIGNPNMTAETTRAQAGPLLYGTYAVTDYAAGQSPEAGAFDLLSKSVYHLPGDQNSAWAYDGVQILARVMRKVGTNPQAIRRGILAMRGYRGVMGTYNFDRNGDGLRQETIVRNVHGHLQVVKVLSF